MELHPQPIALKALHWVITTITRNHSRHFELRWKKSILDILCERRLHLLEPKRFSRDLDITKLLLELLYVLLDLVQGLGTMNSLIVIW